MNFLIPKLDGDKYANLVTVFAVILAVEYTTGAYDIWDAFIGLLAIGLGYSFIKHAKSKDDFWFSFITSSLISLGIVIIFSVIYFMATGFSEPGNSKVKFFFELARFIIFLMISVFVWYNWIRCKSNNKNT